jgi:seryl-tRNA synthetase
MAKYLESAPTVATTAATAISSIMRLAESLMLAAATNKDLKIKTVDDLAKVGKLINDAAKLAEILQGRPADRIEHISAPAAQSTGEAAALGAAMAKLEDRAKAESEAKQTQDVDSETPAGNGPVIDAEFVEVNQGDIESMFIKTVMRQPQPGGEPGQDQAARPPSVEEAQAQAASAE